MKIIIRAFWISILSLSLYSCGKIIVNNTSTSSGYSSSSLDTLIGKWSIHDTAYSSFEFTKSGYYLVLDSIYKEKKRVFDSHYGTYKINKRNVDLSEYGAIKLISLEENSIGFELKFPDQTDTLKLKGKKDPGGVRITSVNTDLLCRNWKVDIVKGKITYSKIKGTIIFTESGTYFANISSSSPSISLNQAAQWVWKNDTTLCTGLNGLPKCDDKNNLKIISLKLNILEYKYDSLTYKYSLAP